MKAFLERLGRTGAILGAALLFAGSAQAQDFPTKPLEWIVSYAPGGTSDTLARVVADAMKHDLGQNVLVNNKPGGSTLIGTQALTEAAADGYTIGSLDTTTMVLNRGTFNQLPYDPDSDFELLGMLGRHPFLLVTNVSAPFNTIEELVVYEKEQPGALNFGSPGQGTSQHIALQALLKSLKIDAVHIPYQGGGPALQDLLANQIQLLLVPPGAVGDMVKAGKIKIMAVTEKERLAALPDVPTVTEAGVDGFVAHSWQLLGMPARAPSPVRARLVASLQNALKAPATVERIHAMGLDVLDMPPAEVREYLRQQTAFWLPLMDDAGIEKQ